jgi:cytochrome c553
LFFNVGCEKTETHGEFIMLRLLRQAVFLVAAIAGISVGASAFAQDATLGQSLYNQNCTVCHGPATSSPVRKGAAPTAISNAINSVNQMQFLKGVLGGADITNIAAYIASANTTTGPVVPAFNVTAMWWVPTESGWGMSAIQSSTNKVFVVIYTYSADNKPTWFVLPDITWTTPTSFNGTLYQTTGPVFNAAPFDPARVVATAVGSLTLNFSDANNAALSYVVNGVTVTKTVTRQVF